MRWIGLGLLWSAFFGVLIGCDGGKAKVTEPGADSSEENSEEPVQASANSDGNEAAPARNPTSLVHKRAGKDWIGDVPLDVWYDDPLAVASTVGDATPVQPNDAASIPNPAPQPMPMPMPMETPQTASGGLDWKRVIPGDLLDAEVTVIRNRLNTDLQTVGSYNSSYLGLPPHFVTLAVLSHVAEKHPDEIRWKKNAPYIKSLAGQMNAEPLRSGPSSQKPLKEKFDNIAEVLNGSVPATLGPPPEGQSIQEVANVKYMMKRLENAAKNITVSGGTADAMKANVAQIKQEAAVLGALTQALLDGYEDYEGDEDFAAFVNTMVDTSIEIREHAQNDQFDKFEVSVSKMNQTCDQCHSTYR
jgi:hypothetical protein